MWRFRAGPFVPRRGANYASVSRQGRASRGREVQAAGAAAERAHGPERLKRRGDDGEGMGSATDRSGYHHGNLREALVAASVEILEREGLAGLGLRAAARAAGVSQTAPYHHFGGKEGLLAAVAAYGFRRLDEAQRSVDEEMLRDELASEEAVRELGVRYVRMACRQPELFKLMFGTALPDRDTYPELVEAYQAAKSHITEAIRRLLVERVGRAEPADIALEVAASWATVHGLATLLIDGRIRPGEDGLPDDDALVRDVLGRFSRSVGERREQLG